MIYLAFVVSASITVLEWYRRLCQNEAPQRSWVILVVLVNGHNPLILLSVPEQNLDLSCRTQFSGIITQEQDTTNADIGYKFPFFPISFSRTHVGWYCENCEICEDVRIYTDRFRSFVGFLGPLVLCP